MKNVGLIVLLTLMMTLGACSTELGHADDGDHDHDGDGVQDHDADGHEVTPHDEEELEAHDEELTHDELHAQGINH